MGSMSFGSTGSRNVASYLDHTAYSSIGTCVCIYIYIYIHIIFDMYV